MKSFGVLLLFNLIYVGYCCRNGWLTHGAKCYHFSRETQSWADATLMCKLMKGLLVEIGDANENNYLKSQARLLGTAESFTDWGPGQPDNLDSHENCGMLESGYDFKWKDMDCYTQQNYICEQDNTSGQVIG